MTKPTERLIGARILWWRLIGFRHNDTECPLCQKPLKQSGSRWYTCQDKKCLFNTYGR